jgi:hypothetical protein
LQFPVADLPTIIEVLAVGEEPLFIVLRYRDFVRFAAVAEAKHTPDVIAVLDVEGEHAFVVVSYIALRSALLSLEITGEIDELAYLEKHKDVAVAVARGALRCGAEHYIIQGYFEQRMVRFVSTGHSGAGIPQYLPDEGKATLLH